MANRPVIVAEGLTKRFGARVAFEDLSFEVEAGEIFGFLGPNGAGKTTTVRVLATLLAPSAGRAEVAGLPIGPSVSPREASELRQRISVMPENSGLYLRLSVRENLEFFGRLYGLARGDALQGAPPAGGARTVAPPPAHRAVPRRADLRVGSGGFPHGARAHRLPPGARDRHLPHDAPSRRGRAPLRPGGGPEDAPALGWPA